MIFLLSPTPNSIVAPVMDTGCLRVRVPVHAFRELDSASRDVIHDVHSTERVTADRYQNRRHRLADYHFRQLWSYSSHSERGRARKVGLFPMARNGEGKRV